MATKEYEEKKAKIEEAAKKSDSETVATVQGMTDEERAAALAQKKAADAIQAKLAKKVAVVPKSRTAN